MSHVLEAPGVTELSLDPTMNAPIFLYGGMPLIKWRRRMGLPIRTTIDDVRDVCGYLAKKPTGATVEDAKKVLDTKRLDGRKLSALKIWGLIEPLEGGRYKVSEEGRRFATGPDSVKQQVFEGVIRRVKPYAAMVERAAHRGESSISATDVAAHWHQHFPDDVGDSDSILNDQAVCFFQIADGAALGKLVIGRKGQPTRFEFDAARIRAFDAGAEDGDGETPIDSPPGDDFVPNGEASQANPPNRLGPQAIPLGQAIFVAHGKNKKPLEQLKRILDQFKVPHKIAVDEPNLGRPIGQKVRETMQACNCAILIFTADEELTDKNGQTIWRPSENVVYELGASGYLYDNRIVILKEESVAFPSNFRELGYISFQKDQLEAKAMEVLKELIGFGIVKIST